MLSYQKDNELLIHPPSSDDNRNKIYKRDQLASHFSLEHQLTVKKTGAEKLAYFLYGFSPGLRGILWRHYSFQWYEMEIHILN